MGVSTNGQRFGVDALDTEEVVEKIAKALCEKFTSRILKGEVWDWYEVARESISVASLHVNLSIALESKRREVAAISACIKTLEESLGGQQAPGQNYIIARSMEHGSAVGVRQCEVEKILKSTVWDLFDRIGK